MGGRGASSNIEKTRMLVLGLYGDLANAERAVKRADRKVLLANIDVELYAGDKSSKQYERYLKAQTKAQAAAKEARNKYERLNKEYNKANERYLRLRSNARNAEEIIPF